MASSLCAGDLLAWFVGTVLWMACMVRWSSLLRRFRTAQTDAQRLQALRGARIWGASTLAMAVFTLLIVVTTFSS